MTPLIKAVAIIYVLLAAVAVIAIDLRIVLIPADLVSLACIGGGVLVFRRMSGALSLPWPATETPADELGVAVIDATSLPFLGYEQELIVSVKTKHLPELIGCALLSGATLYFMVFSSVFDAPDSGLQIGAYEAEIICGAGLGVLLLSLRWFTERLLLQRSRYRIGTLIGRDPGFFRRGVTYQFFDQNHERRGGRGPLRGGTNDNAVLVLYDANQPDRNVAHGSFLFHTFAFVLIPSRNRKQN